MVQGYPNVGMTTAERWWEVGRRVENGSMFSDAEWSVFGRFVLDTDGFNEAYGGMMVHYAEYANTMSMLAYFLALEAEDAEGMVKCKHGLTACVACTGEHGGTWISPPTADVVAEEEPMVEYTHFHIGEFAVPARQPDRRRTWNQKVADGLRKWAHWMEERF